MRHPNRRKNIGEGGGWALPFKGLQSRGKRPGVEICLCSFAAVSAGGIPRVRQSTSTFAKPIAAAHVGKLRRGSGGEGNGAGGRRWEGKGVGHRLFCYKQGPPPDSNKQNRRQYFEEGR
ncbi:unnamed protein product [Boreogadus saida]